MVAWRSCNAPQRVFAALRDEREVCDVDRIGHRLRHRFRSLRRGAGTEKRFIPGSSPAPDERPRPPRSVGRDATPRQGIPSRGASRRSVGVSGWSGRAGMLGFRSRGSRECRCTGPRRPPILAACVAAALVGVPSVARGQVPNNPPQPPPQQPAPPAAQQPSPILTTGQRLAVARPQQSAAAATLSQTISAAVGLRLAPFGAPAPITTGGAPRAALRQPWTAPQCGGPPPSGASSVRPSATWSDSATTACSASTALQLGSPPGIDRRIGDPRRPGVLSAGGSLGDRHGRRRAARGRAFGGPGPSTPAPRSANRARDRRYVGRDRAPRPLYGSPLAGVRIFATKPMARGGQSQRLPVLRSAAGHAGRSASTGCGSGQSAYVDSAGAAAPGFTHADRDRARAVRGARPRHRAAAVRSDAVRERHRLLTTCCARRA